MKALYLHLGYPKTGTSSLQRFLSINYEVLLMDGVCYPRSGREDNETHYNLVRASISNNKKLKPFLTQIEKETVSCSKMILSSETFLDPELNVDLKYAISQLKCLADETFIIVYLRRQDDWAQSFYAQRVSFGPRFLKFRSSDNEFIEKIPAGNLMNTYDICEWFAEMVGIENVIVRPFEPEQFVRGNIYEDFLNILGIKVTNAFHIPEKNVNPSLHGDYLEFMRLCNCVLPDRGKAGRIPGGAVKEMMLKEENVSTCRRHSLISPSKRLEILRKYAKQNERVAKKYLARKDGILFRKHLPDTSNKWVPYDGLSIKRASEIICFISHRIPLKLMLDFINAVEYGYMKNQETRCNAVKVLYQAVQNCKEIIQTIYCISHNSYMVLKRFCLEQSRENKMV